MNKKHLVGYVALAAAFTVLGAIAGVKQDAKGPLTTTYKPTDGRPHTAVTNLYASSLNDLAELSLRIGDLVVRSRGA